MDQRAPLPLVRAVLVTALVLALAGAGHLAGGGALPSPLLLIVLGMGVLGPVAWAAGYRLSLGRLLVILGATQWVLHEAFSVLSAATACHHAPVGHHGLHSGLVSACPPTPVLEIGHHDPIGLGLPMLVGHGLAVVATAVVGAQAENALWLAREWLRPLLAAAGPVRLLLTCPQPPMPLEPRPVLVWRGLRWDRVRGPPVVGVLEMLHRG
ncbi:hypothetical protein [Kocuria arenosa]|uniref:hypothetical protein n=1 Tax=Kocuria arenosa TaxID=3071446 RepID=UPI0034D5DA29